MTEVNSAIISLGSNIEPEQNIDASMKLLQEKFEVLKKSPNLQTKPVDMEGWQPDFINTGCLIKTELSQAELTAKLKELEKSLGRTENSSSSPRTIDLDIVVWNGEIVDDDLYQRYFLQEIVADLQPEVIAQIPAEQLSGTLAQAKQ